tara:strand:- start:95876 stop:96019 length:144 start_codon:yes stop_codon:yes gene_type:complete
MHMNQTTQFNFTIFTGFTDYQIFKVFTQSKNLKSPIEASHLNDEIVK